MFTLSSSVVAVSILSTDAPISLKGTNPPLSAAKFTRPDHVVVVVVVVGVVSVLSVSVEVEVEDVAVVVVVVVVVVVLDVAEMELEGAPGPVGANFKLGREIMMGPVVANPSKSYM